ncbi:FGGY-family carbohydrate kinase [Dyadobacter aurulentus]|uniref:FGGY-family carbohydrate kinase n=1 Tax=Dyadobacter sp. UC 10 TaxID=2605428 RepID=UPI0011F1DCA1|nr:FGGY-family carbohydrate kinase [Dyadobacter sp. UC 10]KAA0988665.1 FGGY-family carbohydrate kinase [Dyadobacter sp. UC 10]
MNSYFLGIDVGTQGVRVVLLDQTGKARSHAEKVFPLTSESRQEQSPLVWWDCCLHCLHELADFIKGNIEISDIRAVSVTSTSGTVIPLDENNIPVHDALMYSDPRSAEEGKMCRQVAETFHPEGYTGFNASSGLSKIVWFVNHFPEKIDRIKTWVHATDFLIGKLSGNYRTTDFTNALKTGFDVGTATWPAYIFQHLPLKKEWLQEVVPSGTVIGSLLPEISALLQIPEIKVVAGMTDGCASQVASGAVSPGDWNTTIGTTLVVKGVTTREIRDPLGRLYCHRHPEGYWMPGGASNTGADWISNGFQEELTVLNEAARQLIPTSLLAYPLMQAGERFPFISPEARGFAPEDIDKNQLFAANMEGVAYMERLSYELIEQLSGEQVNAVYTAGGASNSETWLTIRASVLNKPVYKCRQVTGAAGAAIVAASGSYFKTLTEAAKAMTSVEKVVQPVPELVAPYQAGYELFIEALRDRKYLN